MFPETSHEGFADPVEELATLMVLGFVEDVRYRAVLLRRVRLEHLCVASKRRARSFLPLPGRRVGEDMNSKEFSGDAPSGTLPAAFPEAACGGVGELGTPNTPVAGARGGGGGGGRL